MCSVADDIYPYSQRNSGAVADLEHEKLWRPIADGIVPNADGTSPTNALAVGRSGNNWTCQGGEFLIAGHVVVIDGLHSGELPGGSGGGDIVSLVCVEVDHGQSPWTYDIVLVSGTAGGGRPSVDMTQNAKYQVPLRSITTATNGAHTLGVDERPRLARVGLATLATDPPMWRGWLASNLPISPDNEWKTLGTMQQDISENGAWSQDGHSSIRVIPYDGVYEMYAQVRFSPGNQANASLQLRFVRNPDSGAATGGSELAISLQPRGAARTQTVQLARRDRLQAGDRIGTQVRLSDGSGVERESGSNNTYIEFVWIRP